VSADVPQDEHLADAWLLVLCEELCLAFPAGGVREILADVAVTPLPMVPDHVAGLTQWSGRPLPLLDVARALGLRGTKSRDEASRVVVWEAEESLGLVVDRVLGVEMVRKDLWHPTTMPPVPNRAEVVARQADARGALAHAVDLHQLVELTRVTG
jgi:chemotaxis signal transduction protein